MSQPRLLEAWGYKDAWDYLVFGAGLYGICFNVASFVLRMISVSGAMVFIVVGAVLSQLAIILVYFIIAFFPQVSRKMIPKLHVAWLNTDEVATKFVLFLGAWTTLFFVLLEPVFPWAHLPVFITLLISLQAKKKPRPTSQSPGTTSPASL